jgi:hypothetical protein
MSIRPRRCLALPLLIFTVVLAGCKVGPMNPEFGVTSEQAKAALREMEDAPRRLERPVVVIGGYLDPNVSTTHLTREIKEMTGDDRVIGVVIGFCGSFAECRDKVIEAVDLAFPNPGANETTEVDVVGASLGGLVARYAAAPSLDGKRPRRLKVARLFTISSPHRGARMAVLALNQMQADMRPGSRFLEYVAGCDAAAEYELYPYVCRGDWIVGEEHAAPPGVEPIWLAGSPWHVMDGHRGSWHDARIIADIGRRLRGEEAFSKAWKDEE